MGVMTADFLVCPPHRLSPVDGLSAWDDGTAPLDSGAAFSEWAGFLQRLVQVAGRRIAQAEALRSAPQMSLVSGAGLVHHGIAVVARQRGYWRDDEADYYRGLFVDAGFIVESLPDRVAFAGAADARFDDDGVLWVATGPDTDIDAHWALADILSCEMRSLVLRERRFGNLERCFCPLPGGHLLWYPPAFEPASEDSIRALVPDNRRLAVSKEEADNLACAGLVAGRTVLLSAATDSTLVWLRERGLHGEVVPMPHLRLFGAGPATLALALN